MKPYITVLLIFLGLGAQPAMANVYLTFCEDTAAADPAPAPAPKPEEEPDCE